MGMMYFHVYVAQGATPDVKDEINGPTESMDENEYYKDPEYHEQKAVDNFINWLKGKPESLRDVAQIAGGRGSSYAPRPEHVLNIAQQRRASRKPGLVEKTRGFRVSVSRRMQVLIQDIKSGRFAAKARFLES